MNRQKISIPKFSGKIDEFDQWLEIVKANLDAYKTDVEKTIHLKSLLEGGARTAIKVLQDPSYDDILNELENKYGDVLNKVHIALNTFGEIKKAQDNSLREIERVYTNFASSWNYLEKKCDDLTSLRRSSWMLTSFARKKLPENLIKQFDKNRIRQERENVRQPIQIYTNNLSGILEAVERCSHDSKKIICR